MTDVTFNDPCILFALARESAAFRREFRPHQRFPGAPCRAWFSGPAWLTVLILETGIGASRMEMALNWALAGPVLEIVPYRPNLVLSAGFSGALQDGYQLGDIVLATDVADEAGNVWPTTWPGELPPGEWRPPIRRGRLLTADHLVTTPQEKRDLGQRHGAVAVDMETATVARLCSSREVPFGCVRVISDRMDTPLSPRLVSLFSRGRLSIPRVAWAVLRSPRLTGELWRLGKDTRFAGRHLSTALGELLTLTLPGGDKL